ncbi:MAG TPA: hypothetical protein VKR32_18335 [Puia sp.]|nr:hypothetical protein [Puia sp.]
MEPQSRKRQLLLEFIDRRVFSPLLRLTEHTFIGRHRKIFREAKKKAVHQREDLHSYNSPLEVKEAFLKKVLYGNTRRLIVDGEEFELRMVEEPMKLRDEFIELCQTLDV